jgi:hypothetical protein
MILKLDSYAWKSIASTDYNLAITSTGIAAKCCIFMIMP